MDRANFALARYLVQRGDPVHLVGHRAAADLLDQPNVTFHRVAKPGNSYFLSGPLLDYAGRRCASQIARKGGRVVVNGGNCHWNDVNWVHYVHAAYEPHVGGGALRRLKSRYSHRTFLREERNALLGARLVIVNSDRTGREVSGRIGVPAARVRRVYLGVDRNLFRPISPRERSEAKQRLGWSPRPVLAFVGALGDRRKGFDTLFAACQRLAKDPDWEADVAVVGAGAELPEWQARAAQSGLGERVRFLGFRRDVPAILAASDGFVAPTRYEPYGIAVQEALCTGLPALVSRTAGIAERYPAELEDLLIDNPDDSDELAGRMKMFLAEKDRFDALTAQFSMQLRANGWDEMAAEMMRLVKEC